MVAAACRLTHRQSLRRRSRRPVLGQTYPSRTAIQSPATPPRLRNEGHVAAVSLGRQEGRRYDARRGSRADRRELGMMKLS